MRLDKSITTITLPTEDITLLADMVRHDIEGVEVEQGGGLSDQDAELRLIRLEGILSVLEAQLP